MFFALVSKDKPGHLNLRLETRPTHLEYLEGLNAKGKLKMAGPVLDGDAKPCGTIAIYEAASLDEAKALVDADPYTKAGLFESVDIKPFNWVFNKPEV
jgi:uncharacterized protein